LFLNGAATFYQRFGHPTAAAAAAKVAELEGAEAGLVFSSGMGAITTSLMAVLRGGDHVVAHTAIFDQTRRFLEGPLVGYGVTTTFVDARRVEAIDDASRPETRLVYLETPSNPLLQILDIGAAGKLVRARRVELFVDSTFASPFLQEPLALGATLVLHSGTKYLGGHSDLMCGAVAGRVDLIDRIRAMQILVGTVLDPQGAWLLLRSIKTLGVRVERQCANALAVARFLTRHPAVAEVRYPWLEGTAEEALARRQMRGGGCVVTFRLAGGRVAAARLVERLRLVAIATSLGGVETVAELPYDLDFEPDSWGSDDAELYRGFVRLSVGIEDLADILGDLGQALGGPP
jgi:cystathionine beta-lyase/cystathionine gamma-synthase